MEKESLLGPAIRGGVIKNVTIQLIITFLRRFLLFFF